MEAVHAVKKRKMKVSAAVARFGIPHSTLYDHAKRDIRIGGGSPAILSHAEEKEIFVTLQVLQEMGKWFDKVDKVFSDIGFKNMGEDELQHRV